MRILSFILALTIYGVGISSQGPLSELNSLSALVAHYQEHKAMDGDNFWQFFVEDYLSDKGDREGHHNSSSKGNLPFHEEHSQSHSYNLYFYIHQIPLLSLARGGVKTVTAYQFSYSNPYLDSIFQPPRV